MAAITIPFDEMQAARLGAEGLPYLVPSPKQSQSLLPHDVVKFVKQGITTASMGAEIDRIANSVAEIAMHHPDSFQSTLSNGAVKATTAVQPIAHIENPTLLQVSDAVNSYALTAISGVSPIISGCLGLRQCSDELDELFSLYNIHKENKPERIQKLEEQIKIFEDKLNNDPSLDSTEKSSICLKIKKLNKLIEIINLKNPLDKNLYIAREIAVCLLRMVAHVLMILSGIATLAGLLVSKLAHVLEKLGHALQTVFKALASWGPIVGAITTGMLIITDTIDLIKLLANVELIEKLLNGKELTQKDLQNIKLIKEKLLSLMANICMFTSYVLTILITGAAGTAAAMNPEIVFAIILVLSIISVICHIVEKWDTIKDFAVNHKGVALALLVVIVLFIALGITEGIGSG